MIKEHISVEAGDGLMGGLVGWVGGWLCGWVVVGGGGGLLVGE